MPDGKDNAPAQTATVNKQAAASVATGAVTALSATVDGNANGSNGAASAGSLAAVAQSSQGLLQSSGPGAMQTRTYDGAGEDLSALDFNSPGCQCTGTECNFSSCSPLGDAKGQYKYTIDGYYSWGNGHVICKDLKYTFSSNGGAGAVSSSNVVVTLNCDVTVTPSSINGFIQSAGSSSAQVAGQSTQAAYSASWDVKTTFNNVTFGANHQPTGGSMHVEGTTSANYGGQSQKSGGSADVEFPVK